MKTLRSLLAALAILPALAFAAASPNVASMKSPAHYFVCRYTWSTLANISGAPVCVLPQSGMKLIDVITTQVAAGAGGTSWVVTPKRDAVDMVTTSPGWTRAGGANHATGVASSPIKPLSVATGGTRPVIKKGTFASQTYIAGTVVAGNTVTIGGVVYTAAASGNGTSTYTTGGATTTTTATNLAAAINRNPNSKVTAQVTDSTVTVYARAPGAAGNAITTVASANYTVGAGTLAGGYDYASSGGDIITVDVTTTGTYSVTNFTGIMELYFEQP